jgi:mono/diheme cytochrome c family protein
VSTRVFGSSLRCNLSISQSLEGKHHAWFQENFTTGEAVLPICGRRRAVVSNRRHRPNSNGPEIYRQSGCVVCHGGLGTGGFGPKLAGDPILAISQFVIAQVLLGRGQMPPFGDKLSDPQIATVAQYIRTSWGNDFGPVSTQQVADTRSLMERALQTTARVSRAQH